MASVQISKSFSAAHSKAGHNKALQEYLESNNLVDMVHIFHIESPDFDADIFLDNIHSDKDERFYQQALHALKTSQTRRKATKAILVQSNSPTIIENYSDLTSIQKSLLSKKTLSTIASIKANNRSVGITLSEINKAAEEQKRRLDSFSLLRTVVGKLEVIKAKQDQLRWLVTKKSLSDLIFFLKELDLEVVVNNKNLVFFRGFFEGFEELFSQILGQFVDKIDITKPVEEVEVELSLFKSLTRHKVLSIGDEYIWKVFFQRFKALLISRGRLGSATSINNAYLSKKQVFVKQLKMSNLDYFFMKRRDLIPVYQQSLLKRVEQISVAVENLLFLFDNIFEEDRSRTNECVVKFAEVFKMNIPALFEDRRGFLRKVDKNSNFEIFEKLGQLYLLIFKRFSQDEDVEVRKVVSVFYNQIKWFVVNSYKTLFEQFLRAERQQGSLSDARSSYYVLFEEFCCSNMDKVFEMSFLACLTTAKEVFQFVSELLGMLVDTVIRFMDEDGKVIEFESEGAHKLDVSESDRDDG